MNDVVVERANAKKPAKRHGAKTVRVVQVKHYETIPSYSLASEAGRIAVAKLQAQMDADPAKAAAFFQSAGILTRTGRLAKRYGG